MLDIKTNQMEQMTELLRELALKLGTTTEYLWEVLIRQAYVSGIIGLTGGVFILILGGILYRAHKAFDKEDEYGDCMYDNEPAVIMMLFFAIIWSIGLIVYVAHFGNFVTALINPEYWALKEILKQL